ncbi:unnamed protein product [Tuber melanosporum]|uniref:(Perigord truffle) hypothetical protein n=1 Tax=Tuber melanosporum (strain Mel28) TaxID=656061 RepID=D5GPE1_TUBMM|nr:uncharacterized protein GSTUM_00011691001 [Tuber melanosporum]CAZ86303.1 unnamed protein product [Tuber melanosporum]
MQAHDPIHEGISLQTRAGQVTLCPSRNAHSHMASRSRKASSLTISSPILQCLQYRTPPLALLPLPRRIQTAAEGGGTGRYLPPRKIIHARPQKRAPFPIRNPRPFAVNDDPARLNEMYTTLLGRDMGLTDEVKWQAVTHKSFDHGHQPFNEKLAIYGKRVCWLHASLHLLNGPPIEDKRVYEPPNFVSSLDGTPYRKPEPFLHRDYKSLVSIKDRNIRAILDPGKLATIARLVRLDNVMRWKPKDSDNLHESGQALVATQALYAIVGALALQRGGDIAGGVVRERLLSSIDWVLEKTKDMES